jgi:hypothetical protein
MGYTSQNRVAPKFVSARTPKLLEQEMERLILRTGKQYDFYIIQKVESKWFAWYRDDIKLNISNKIGG